MKIFLFTPFYPPQSQAAAIRCFWLAETLRNDNHTVEVTSSQNMRFTPADNKQSFLKRLIYEFVAGIELFYKIFSSNHSLYILSSPPFITISLAHLACRIRGHKYLIDVRDIYPDVYFAQGLIQENSLLGKLVKSFTRSMYSHATGVTTVTPGLVKKILKLSPTARVELLINGYDKDLFKPSATKYEKFTVIFHGNMGKVQNIPTILKVAERLHDQDIEFVFIGEGPQAELFDRPQPQNIKYIGPRNYSEIPHLIARAHVGFSARRDDEIGADAFPVKVFEYIGVGIPVIMTPKSGIMPQMVQSGIYEFDNDAIDEMAQKILELKSTDEIVKLKDDLSRQGVSKKILQFCHFN